MRRRRVTVTVDVDLDIDGDLSTIQAARAFCGQQPLLAFAVGPLSDNRLVIPRDARVVGYSDQTTEKAA